MSSDRGEMIVFLDSIYPGWRRKLEQLPYAQIRAIYLKYIKLRMGAQIQAINEREYERLLAEEAKRPKVTDYLCYMCNRYFEADNPELQECRFCGSHNIRRIIYD